MAFLKVLLLLLVVTSLCKAPTRHCRSHQAAWMHITDLALGKNFRKPKPLPYYEPQLLAPEFLGVCSLPNSHGAAMLRRLKILADMLYLRCKQLNLDFPATLPYRDWTKFLLPNRRGLEGLLRSQGMFPELIQGDKVLFMLTMADALVPQGIAALYRLLPLIAALPARPEAEILPPPLPKQEISPGAWARPGKSPHCRPKGKSPVRFLPSSSRDHGGGPGAAPGTRTY